MSPPVPRRLIVPALLLALIVLPLGYAAVELWRWLDEQHSTEARIEAEERRGQPIRRRLHLVGIAVDHLAAGRMSLPEAAAWERVLEPHPRRGREGEDAEWYCRAMLRHLAELARVSGSPEYAEAVRRERAELDCLLAGFAPLVLPEPPQLPGMPPRSEE